MKLDEFNQHTFASVSLRLITNTVTTAFQSMTYCQHVG